MAYGIFQAISDIEEFAELPHHKTAVREIVRHSAAGETGRTLRQTVSRIRAAFLEYRCDLTTCGEAW